MSAYNSVSKGLEEALAFAEGKSKGERVYEIEVPDVNVAEIRQKTGLSQSEFARSIGVAKGVVARIGCQVLTQAFATTTDMLNAA